MNTNAAPAYAAAELTNVNLLYQRRAKGVAPLSRFAVGDDGALLVSVPDEMEVRAFHIVRFDSAGRSQVLETYSVETLRKTEIADGGSLFVGTTDNDLYLFTNAKKSRFLPDRRASYTDIALNQSGKRFAVAFCDLLASGHSVALGDTGGRLLWTKDVGFEIVVVAVNRGATHIAIGGFAAVGEEDGGERDGGEVVLLDTARQSLFTHRHERPVSLVATTGSDGRGTAFVSDAGVGLLDVQGRQLWFTELSGGVAVGLALDADARTTAVLLRTDESAGRLLFLNADGLPVWDVDFDEARPTGLSLSANGQFAAVTLRDGRISLFELQYGERLASVDTEQVLNEARQAREGGNSSAGIDLLRARLLAVPSDTISADALGQMLASSRETLFAQAYDAVAVGDFAFAELRLAEAVTQDNLNSEAVARRADVRKQWATAMRTQARAALMAGDGQTAETCLLTAIQADESDVEARSLLADARHTAAESALAEGQAHLATGAFAHAIASLTRAQTFGASGLELANLLRRARAGDALALGNQLYQDRQYAAALFQYKKALRFDPENADARQKSNYAQNFLQDNQLNERFTRLE